jgi:hypothetical protein
MFEFVGKLMGLAIRSKSLINLSLPSIVWKPLVNDAVNETDVLAIDSLSFQTVELIRQLSELPPDQFDREMEEIKFVTVASDGRSIPLMPGGENMTLTWQNKDEYVRLLLESRLNEFRLQVEVHLYVARA